MVVVALLSVDLVESVDLVSVVLVVNCTKKNHQKKNMLNSNEFWGIFMQYLLQGDSYPARQLSNDPCSMHQKCV